MSIVYWFAVLRSPLSELLSLLLDIIGTRSNLRRGRLDWPSSSHAHTGTRTLSLPSSWSLMLPTETCLGQLEDPQLSLQSPGFSFEMLFLFLLHTLLPEGIVLPSRWRGQTIRCGHCFLTTQLIISAANRRVCAGRHRPRPIFSVPFTHLGK